MKTSDKPHFITKVTGSEKPHNVIFFDTETTSNQLSDTSSLLSLKLGYAVYCRLSVYNKYIKYKDCLFNTSIEFCEFIKSVCRNNTTIYLFAHNLSFDLLSSKVFEVFPEHDINMKSFYSKGMVSIYRFMYNKTSIVAINTGNFFPTSLDKIGKMVGVNKIDIDFENSTTDALIEYCKNDVEILIKAMENWLGFLEDNGLGSFKNTLAGTSFNIFRYKFLSHKIYVHKDENIAILERESYHGGRVEANRVGYFNDGEYYKLDINSMYPYVCSLFSFPVSRYTVPKKASISTLHTKIKHYSVVAKVIIETEEQAFPVKYNNRLIYPVGRFITYLTTPELEYAINNNNILDVISMVYYQKQPIFRDFMTYFYDLRIKYRQEGNEIYDRISKTIGNSLYGKFGQLNQEVKWIGYNKSGKIKIESGTDNRNLTPFQHYYFPNDVFEVTKGGYSYNSFPAIASHVTAYARAYLYKLKAIAGFDNVFYNDTDSLIVNKTGYNRLLPYVNNDAIGMLKVEEMCEWIEIVCPKSYKTPSSVKQKGIRQNAIEFDQNHFVQDQFSGLNGMLREGRLDGVKLSLIEKQLSLKINGGYPPDAEGFVRPFVLDVHQGQNVLSP